MLCSSTPTLSIPLKSLKVAMEGRDIPDMQEKASMPADSFVLGTTGVTRELPTEPIPYAPKPQPQRPAWVRPAVGALAFVIGAAGGFLGWRMLFGPYSFPDEIAGVERLESDLVDGLVEIMKETARSQAGVEMDVAVYGNALQPDYVMFTAELEDPSMVMQALAAGDDPNTVPQIDLSGNTVGCAPNLGGASCAWMEGDRMVGLGGSSGPEQLHAVALGLKES
jgi:hypothetical protein